MKVDGKHFMPLLNEGAPYKMFKLIIVASSFLEKRRENVRKMAMKYSSSSF